MKLTSRDLEAIDFLEFHRIASTSTLEHFIYKSRRVAQRRLKMMADSKYVKRSQDYINRDYSYYIEKPKQFRHSLLITEFYKEFSKYVDIKYFETQKKIDHIIPDGLIGYVESGIKKVAILEVEISNKGFDYAKYHNFPYKKYFNTFPNVFVVSKHRIKKDNKINFIQIRDIKHDLEQFFHSDVKYVI